MSEFVLFWILSGMAVVASIYAISCKNPLDCAMALIVVLAAMAGMFWLLDARVIAVLQVLIYAGAIVSLILFVIMLLNVPERRLPQDSAAPYWIAVLSVLALIMAVVAKPDEARERPKVITYAQQLNPKDTDSAHPNRDAIQHLSADEYEKREMREAETFGTMRQISRRIFGTAVTAPDGTTTRRLGKYLLPFEILSLLLLVAAVGSMVLTKQKI